MFNALNSYHGNYGNRLLLTFKISKILFSNCIHLTFVGQFSDKTIRIKLPRQHLIMMCDYKLLMKKILNEAAGAWSIIQMCKSHSAINGKRSKTAEFWSKRPIWGRKWSMSKLPMPGPMWPIYKLKRPFLFKTADVLSKFYRPILNKINILRLKIWVTSAPFDPKRYIFHRRSKLFLSIWVS